MSSVKIPAFSCRYSLKYGSVPETSIHLYDPLLKTGFTHRKSILQKYGYFPYYLEVAGINRFPGFRRKTELFLIGGLKSNLLLFQNKLFFVALNNDGCIVDCDLFHHGCCIRVKFADNYRNSPLDDSPLLGCDLFHCTAKQVCMVETHRGDDRNYWSDNVGSIQPSSQSELYDSYIDLLTAKIPETNNGTQFKIGQRFLVYQLLKLPKERQQGLLVHSLAINFEAVPKVSQVGRSIESCFISRLLINGCQETAHRSFAVCARNMNRTEVHVGVTHRFQELQHRLQSESDGC